MGVALTMGETMAYKSKSVISKRSKRNPGWGASSKLDKILERHSKQNWEIRKSRKPIEKPDLDAIMEEALAK